MVGGGGKDLHGSPREVYYHGLFTMQMHSGPICVHVRDTHCKHSDRPLWRGGFIPWQ